MRALEFLSKLLNTVIAVAFVIALAGVW